MVWLGVLVGCHAAAEQPDASEPSDAAAPDAGDAGVVDHGIEPTGDVMRFELAGLMCSPALLDAGAGCPPDDQSCLCQPEFDVVNPAKGSASNPDGRVIVISQPRYGKRPDGSYAFDAYAAIKARGNHVGHYVNELNPTASCTTADAWTPDAGCAGGSECGWRCVPGASWADQLIDAEIVTYGDYPAPALIALNEAWSIVYADSTEGIYYRQWLRDVSKQLAARGRLPLLFVQTKSVPVGPYTLLAETAQYALLGVEAYASGRDILNAPGQCAPPYDASNWCYRRYEQIRSAIRSSANPQIPLARLIMTEHFGDNLLHYVDPQGNPQTAGWGRAYDNDPNSSTFGTPSASFWNTAVERRSHALKALPSLAGVSSYCWACNRAGGDSSYRVQIGKTWATISVP
jgi:hypothetical protein